MSSMSQGRAIAVFLAFASAYFISTLIRAVTGTLAPTLVAEFSLNARDLGLLAGGYFLGFAAIQLPLGAWLDRHGPRKVVLGFLTVAVLACFAFALADSFVGLVVARMLSGFGVSACLMAPLTGYRRWYAPGSQMRANAWMLMVGALGMVAATLPVQWLLPLTGWRALFWGLGGLVLLAMLLIAWLVPGWTAPTPVAPGTAPAAVPAAAAKPGGYAEVWRNPYFRRMAPLGLVHYGGMVAWQTLWASPWMVRVGGYTPLEAATGLFWINVAMLVTFWLWGLANPWLQRHHLDANRMISYGVPLSLVVLVVLGWGGAALGPQAALLLLLFCVISTVSSFAQPAVALAFRPEMAGRALSAFNLVIFCGVFAVQWGIGLAIDGFKALGWAEVVAFQAALAVYALCCLGAYLHFLRHR